MAVNGKTQTEKKRFRSKKSVVRFAGMEKIQISIGKDAG